MKIISINCGSSSFKFKLFEMPEESVITEGQFEKIGANEDGIYTIKINGVKNQTRIPLKDHSTAIQILLNDLVERNIIASLDEIKGVGNRVVQGGSYFNKTVIINEDVKEKIRKLIDLAPLHNGPNLIGIEALEKVLPNVKQTAVFDTAFHQTMEEDAYLYAIPYDWYKNYGIRKYGAHGTSHFYVSREYARLTNKNIEDLKIITCHCGNGVSICAVDKGKSKDTSMGLTPLEGVPMGTRSGSVDPTIVSYIANKENKDASVVINELNKQSGYFGFTEGISSDYRNISEAMLNGNPQAKAVVELQAKRIADYIGSYYVYMGGCDAIIFTAGIGENSGLFRKGILDRLKVLGIKINEERNNEFGHAIHLSEEDSKIDVWAIPTNEELVIARDTYSLITE